MRLTYWDTLIVVCLLGCKNNRAKFLVQFAVTDKLIQAFIKNDTAKIFALMGAPLKDIARDEEGLVFDISKAHRIIKLYGLPQEDNYLLTEYEYKKAELLDITIPFFERNKKGSKQTIIIVYFVKYLPEDKILDFKVE